MPEINDLLRALPKVDELLQRPELERLAAGTSRAQCVSAARFELDRLRRLIRQGFVRELPDEGEIIALIEARAEKSACASLRPVINATGIVLHTNLGRAPLASEAIDAVTAAARGYSTLEYDIETGGRGSRMSHISGLLRELCGAEDAVAVNNNAAAVLLALTALARDRQVIISRGELVEIGGAFRVPEVMEQSGCKLVEVGTTNKTRLSDYERAITAETGAILKVHSSNFRLLGFTESTPMDELCSLARRHELPLIHDLGSGCLMPGDTLGLPDEPTVRQSVAGGADIVTFSGDKLLGGPQAGIIIGRVALVEKIRKHPLARAMRIDKLTLAALEATLRLYLSGNGALGKIPILAMLSADEAALRARAEALCALINHSCGPRCAAAVAQVEGLAGGGSAPGEGLASWAAAVEPQDMPLTMLEEQLRLGSPHIIGRIARGRLLLDTRTLLDGELEAVAQRLGEIFAPDGEPQ